MTESFKFKPLSPSRWADFEALFGKNGACGGCWCMAWRLAPKDFRQQQGTGNKRAIKKLVDRGTQPGILAYKGKEPVGWIALAPREEYVRLEGSRVLGRVDDQPVWSVSCFFVRKDCRKQGLTAELLKAAAEFARKKGARFVEGYPYDLDKPQAPPFVWTGLFSAFQKAGFKEVARRSKTRPIMRMTL